MKYFDVLVRPYVSDNAKGLAKGPQNKRNIWNVRQYFDFFNFLILLTLTAYTFSISDIQHTLAKFLYLVAKPCLNFTVWFVIIQIFRKTYLHPWVDCTTCNFIVSKPVNNVHDKHFFVKTRAHTDLRFPEKATCNQNRKKIPRIVQPY